MSTVYSVEAYSFASRFNLRDAATWLPSDSTIRWAKTQFIVSFNHDQLLYVYDFGALVFINVAASEREPLVSVFAAKLTHEPHPPLRETFLVEVRPGASVEVSFDRVVVPQIASGALDVIATVLAQSVAIDYYDEDVEEILDRIGDVAREVARRGRPLGRTSDFVKFVGTAIASEVEMISAISLLDKPDLTWENEDADKLHDKLRSNLEISERHKALEIKLSTIRDSLQTLIEFSQTRRMLFLEATVVFLIVLEIILSFMKL
ncbi:MAG TPA: RMD1 family protein [Polyangium sp.]|nr:RMD1 family protein [Polyangium sp.]